MGEQSTMVPSSEPHWGESGMSSRPRNGIAVLQWRSVTLTPFCSLFLMNAAGGGLTPHSGGR